jgi:hypothetical protein
VETLNVSDLELDVRGTGIILGNIHAKDIDADIEGTGTLKGHFETTRMSAEIRGTGTIELSGTAQNFELSLSGAGNMKGQNFVTDNADVQVKGTGTATLNAKDELTGGVSGAGKIRYYGSPKVQVTQNGTGKVEAMK